MLDSLPRLPTGGADASGMSGVVALGGTAAVAGYNSNTTPYANNQSHSLDHMKAAPTGEGSNEPGIPLSRVYSNSWEAQPLAMPLSGEEHLGLGLGLGGTGMAATNYGSPDYGLDRQNTFLTQQSLGSTTPLIPLDSPGSQGSLVKVTTEYIPSRPDELCLKPGDNLWVEQTFQDGKNFITEEF